MTDKDLPDWVKANAVGDPMLPPAADRKKAAEADVAVGTTGSDIAKAGAEAALKVQQARLAKIRADKAEKAAEQEAGAETEAELQAKFDMASKRNQFTGYLDEIDAARRLIAGPASKGPVAQLFGGIYESPSYKLAAVLESIANPVVLQAMAEARKGSKVGATGFGALSNKELSLLKSAWGSLDPGNLEGTLRTLDRVEKHFRRFVAYESGVDPDSMEGASLVGLPYEGEDAPKGELPPPVGVDISKGQWKKRPQYAGVDATVTAMIKAGRSEAQIREWLNAFETGLGDKASNINANIRQWRDYKRDPNVTIERYFEEGEGDEPFATTGPGAFMLGAADVGSGGTVDEFSANPEQTRALMRGVSEKHPLAYSLGQAAGGLTSGLGAELLAAKYGMRAPWLLQGTGQSALYGAGSTDSSSMADRAYGAIAGAVEAPISNIVGYGLTKPFTSAMRGSTGPSRILSEKYNIPLTPGQRSGNKRGFEETLANVPIVGEQVKARRNESLQAFNKAAFDEALSPIGVSARGTGQRGVAEAQTLVEQAYKEALDGVELRQTTQFKRSVGGARNALAEVDPAIAQQVDTILAASTDPRTGLITGAGLQDALGQLRNLNADYASVPGSRTQISPKINAISDSFADLMRRQAPDKYNAFRDANTAYRNVSILGDAVNKSKEQGQIFGPNQLRQSTSAGTNKFGGKRASARGDRPFNELVMNAMQIVPEKLDEASLGKQLGIGGVGVGGGTLLLSSLGSGEGEEGRGEEPSGVVPPGLVYGTGALLTGLLPYSRSGSRSLSNIMGGRRTPRQRQLADLLELYVPAAGRGTTRGVLAEPPAAPYPETPIASDRFLEQAQKAAERPFVLEPEAEQETIFTIGDRTFSYDPETDEVVEEETGWRGANLEDFFNPLAR